MEHFSQSEIGPEDPQWEELMEEVCRAREMEEEMEEEEEEPYSPKVLETHSHEDMVRLYVCCKV